MCSSFVFSLALTQSFAASDAKAPAPPSPSKGSPWWHPDPSKLQKCTGAYRTAPGTCYREIFVSFWIRKVAIGEDCCKDIVEADDDCASTVFSQFNNHFFQMLKQHCSNKEGHASTIATKGNTGTTSTESNTITTKVIRFLVES